MRHRPSTFRYQIIERTPRYVVDGERILQVCRVRRLSDGATGTMGVPA
jgi:hypothetical protein